MKKAKAKKGRRTAKPRPFDQKKEIRAIARERVGAVKASRVIPEKPGLAKTSRGAKHKKTPQPDGWENDQ